MLRGWYNEALTMGTKEAEAAVLFRNATCIFQRDVILTRWAGSKSRAQSG
jgi:hypothetical protein